MNITDPQFIWTPAVATDIRKTWARVDQSDDWRSRLEGAAEVMRKIAARGMSATNVRRLPARKA